MSTSSSTNAAETGTGRGDALSAFRNAVTLGGSMVATLVIGLGVRMLMPRFLGPDAFGPLSFADAFTATFFVALSLGLDTYIRKEVPLNPRVASDFLGGITALRLVGTVVLLAVMQVVLMATHRPREVWLLVHLFGVANFLLAMNQTFAALLHARGAVGGLSTLTVGAKVLWGAGTLAALALRAPLWAFALVLLVSEALKGAVGLGLVRRHLGLVWRLDAPAVRVAVLASLPMFINTVSHTVYGRLDVSLLAVVAGDREVAWYGAAALIAGLTLVAAPMIGWVLMPLYARARARSEDEYTRALRRSLELVLLIAFPTALLIALGADVLVVALFGEAFAPAAAALRVLSPLFVLTYVAMVSATSLVLSDRAWAQAGISVAGLVFNPLLNAFTIPRGARWFGEGGAGLGAAASQVGTEVLVTALMTALVGARAFDRRSAVTVAKTVGVCAAVAALDAALTSVLAPFPRLGVDALACAILLPVVGALHVDEAVAFVREAFAARERRAA